MKSITKTKIPGVFVIQMFNMADNRGTFVKPYHQPTMKEWGLQDQFNESFYSINQKGVVRGMHFQTPPHDHAKLIYCSQGKLIDVILDIRIGSPTYGKYETIELNDKNFQAVYLPVGVAHGFCVLENNTCMVYLTSTVHHAPSDAGVLWNSFGYDWPVENAINSERDKSFPPLSQLKSPFIF